MYIIVIPIVFRPEKFSGILRSKKRLFRREMPIFSSSVKIDRRVPAGGAGFLCYRGYPYPRFGLEKAILEFRRHRPQFPQKSRSDSAIRTDFTDTQFGPQISHRGRQKANGIQLASIRPGKGALEFLRRCREFCAQFYAKSLGDAARRTYFTDVPLRAPNSDLEYPKFWPFESARRGTDDRLLIQRKLDL